MSVYVDDMKAKVKRGFRTYVMCHMVADSEGELHRMAEKIGVDRKWFHRGHYNIAQSKKALAVALGAKQINRRELAVIWIELKKKSLKP